MTESFRFAFCCVVLLCFVKTIIQKRTRVTFYCVNLIEDFDRCLRCLSFNRTRFGLTNVWDI